MSGHRKFKRAISLCVGALVVVSWVISLEMQLGVVIDGALLRIARGGIEFVTADSPFDSDPRFSVTRERLGVAWMPQVREVRVSVFPGTGVPVKRVERFVPLWCALLPAIAALWYWRPHRRWTYLWSECTACAYNLTGNTSGVCPECGKAIPPEQRAHLEPGVGEYAAELRRLDEQWGLNVLRGVHWVRMGCIFYGALVGLYTILVVTQLLAELSVEKQFAPLKSFAYAVFLIGGYGSFAFFLVGVFFSTAPDPLLRPKEPPLSLGSCQRYGSLLLILLIILSDAGHVDCVLSGAGRHAAVFAHLRATALIAAIPLLLAVLLGWIVHIGHVLTRFGLQSFRRGIRLSMICVAVSAGACVVVPFVELLRLGEFVEIIATILLAMCAMSVLLLPLFGIGFLGRTERAIRESMDRHPQQEVARLEQ